jgi:hypothetical protein
LVDGSKRPLAHRGRPDQSINVLDRLDLRLDNTHPCLLNAPEASNAPDAGESNGFSYL